MNQLTIIGNLTKDPESRTTVTGVNVCCFTVAANNKKGDAGFFRVNAWRELGENCGKYLSKGKKVCVVGPVKLNLFTSKNGEKAPMMEINADSVEFLSPKQESGYTEIEEYIFE